MSERRVDPFTGQGVWIAPGRAGLGATRPGGLPTPRARCPFCPGHESDAEPTVAQWPARGPWQARVVRNKYPLVAPPQGDHEVGIDARGHDVDLGDLSPAHVAGMLRLYRDRYRALGQPAGVAAVVLFRNRGRRAGSSQPHPHTQLVALPEVPVSISRRAQHGAGLDLHVEERRRAQGDGRVVHERASAVALCPFAPSRAHEVRISACEAGGFEAAEDATLDDVGSLLVQVLSGITGGLGVADHNLVLRSAPRDASGWSLDVLPRTGGDAGFEQASEERVIVVPPEVTAAQLRELGPSPRA
ncbi:MAG: DUF4931 domain-containing protein [Sandaracinaceae bacterium]